MSTVLEKPVLLDETGQAIVNKLEDIKDMIGTTGEFIPVQIIVTTPPTKTTYSAGETLDLSGIVVKLEGSNGAMFDVTAQCTFSPDNGDVLTSSDTSVLISYHWYKDNIDFSTRQPIKIKSLSSITVTSAPTKTQYYAGETLDITGLVVVATYDDTSTYIVTDQCTFSPDDGDTLSSSDTAIAISYTAGVTTKTTSQAISVKELSSIAVTTPPTTTQYVEGDMLDLTGIVVTATFTDTSSAVVTNQCVFSPAEGATLSSSVNEVGISCTLGSFTKTTTQSIFVAAIYGVEWDGSALSAMTRTDSAESFTDPSPYYENKQNNSSPFDSIMPWSGMQVKTISIGGNTNEFVEIPKFYYKWTRDGAKMKLQISMYPSEGFHVSPAHADRGDGVGERDYIYVSRYHCTIGGLSTGSGASNYTRAAFRTSIHNMNQYLWQWDYATWWTINMLYLVEFADWNCQGKIGMGNNINSGNTSSASSENSISSMPYHTGTMANQPAANGAVQYRYIADLWANLQTFVDGIRLEYVSDSYPYQYNAYIISNPADFSDTTGGTLVPSNWTSKNNSIKEWSDANEITGYEYAILPTKASSSYNEYCCDSFGSDEVTNNTCFFTGYGYYGITSTWGDNQKLGGLFALRGVPSNTQKNLIGSRSMYLPSERVS